MSVKEAGRGGEGTGGREARDIDEGKYSWVKDVVHCKF